VLDGYRFIREQRVAFRDFDYFRHVNNAAYVTWAETIRIEYMDEILSVPPNARIGIIMAAQRFDYVAQVGYGERVMVGCRAGRMGTKSFDLEYEIFNVTTETLALRAFSTVVAFDYDRNVSIPIPQEWRATIAAFETPSTA
jgi:acyl-CoA thioester hydrolase